MPRRTFLLLLLLSAAFPLAAATVFPQECSPPPITANRKNYNVFTAEQEMVLGELTYERMAGELRFVRDPGLNAYVERIGSKLIKHLPPTGLKFQFFIIDIPEANAFNIPGGYVFLSRKLIGFSANEDELAGVIAHELGQRLFILSEQQTAYAFDLAKWKRSPWPRQFPRRETGNCCSSAFAREISLSSGYGLWR